MMTTETRKVIAEHNGYELVTYAPQGEKRIEHTASKTASDWLYYKDVEAISADPASMENYALDLDIPDDES